MTISEYIRQIFLDFGLRLSDAALLGILLREGIDGDIPVEKDNVRDVDMSVVKAIPALLLTPQSVSEGGYSLSRAQRDSIEAFYNLKCKEFGIRNDLEKKPSVKIL